VGLWEYVDWVTLSVHESQTSNLQGIGCVIVFTVKKFSINFDYAYWWWVMVEWSSVE